MKRKLSSEIYPPQNLACPICGVPGSEQDSLCTCKNGHEWHTMADGTLNVTKPPRRICTCGYSACPGIWCNKCDFCTGRLHGNCNIGD